MIINTKTYEQLPFCEKEILRYSGCKSSDSEVISLMRSCIEEVSNSLSYKVCWCALSVKTSDDLCDFGDFCVKSKDLSKYLGNSSNIILMAATIGVSIDRLITKYSRLSPSRALMMQAIGAERIETLCDAFCHEFNCGTRFSPGYGDLPLLVQKDIFRILNCEKKIGLYLSDSLLMTPSKSVTAFAKAGVTHNKCTDCAKTDCEYRGAI